jgi:acetolactate synthase-1/2/3 large subunit
MNAQTETYVHSNGLEKRPMRRRLSYEGWDVAADLNQHTSYDQVVEALGGAGETVEKPGDLASALERAFASGVPYLINVLTDPEAAYPRGASSSA